jgi:hypothetical protein
VVGRSEGEGVIFELMLFRDLAGYFDKIRQVYGVIFATEFDKELALDLEGFGQAEKTAKRNEGAVAKNSDFVGVEILREGEITGFEAKLGLHDLALEGESLFGGVDNPSRADTGFIIHGGHFFNNDDMPTKQFKVFARVRNSRRPF